MQARVGEFLQEYQCAIGDGDAASIANLYADAFLFAGPQGAQIVQKQDFLKVIPKRKAYFASMGLRDSKLKSFNEISLDAKYLLVKTVWSMHLHPPKGGSKEIETSATYILEQTHEQLRIMAQIDHQDLAAKVSEAIQPGNE